MRRVLTAAVLVLLTTPGVAHAGWSEPQTFGDLGGAGADVAVATNARGDAVAVWDAGTTMVAARSSRGGRFASPYALPDRGLGHTPKVAIDRRGTAVISWAYDDESDPARDLRDDGCCTGTRVVVWRAGHAPSRSRAALPRGRRSGISIPVATTQGRGVVVAAAGTRVFWIPLRRDGRPGRARGVAGVAWQPAAAQLVRGRARVALVQSGKPARLATVAQRRGGRFNPIRVRARLGGRVYFYPNEPQISDLHVRSDGRGGFVAVRRFSQPRHAVQRMRITPHGRVRTVRVGLARRDTGFVRLAPPAVDPDGGALVVLGERPRRGNEVVYLLRIAPSGRTRRWRVGAPENVASFAVAASRSGRGVVALSAILPQRGRFAMLLPLAAGAIPRPSGALTVQTGLYDDPIVTVDGRGRALALTTSRPAGDPQGWLTGPLEARRYHP